MWWPRFLSSIALLFAFLLLIIPGVYLLTRLCFVESIVVAEGISGSRAMRRSFEITKDRFWPTFRLGLVLLLLGVVSGAAVILPTVFIPALDYWLIDAASQLACDVIGAFITVALLCGYKAYSNEPGNA
jgi:membrane-anchored glycerophosphoryl diester phosphodiesterase (GDPDase)